MKFLCLFMLLLSLFVATLSIATGDKLFAIYMFLFVLYWQKELHRALDR